MQRSKYIRVLTGNYAAAYAAMHSRVEVVAAYPITPQTTVVEKIDELIASGEMDSIMIRVESEHSAMAAAIGASAAGARAFTATSSHGLFYMYENIWWAANSRVPTVAAFITRAMAPPWNIWSDHQDVYALRDSGWILFFARNAQEVYDLTIQAFKIGENDDIRLPVGVAYDAFIISHTSERVEMLYQDEVDKFLPPPTHIKPLLDPENPVSVGNLPKAEQHYALRKNIWDCINYSLDYIKKVGEEYRSISGRDYSDPLPSYRIEDAEYIFITVGAMSGDGEDAVDILREKGYKVGQISVRLLRPFPDKDLVSKIEEARSLIIFNRGMSMGKGGIITEEVNDTLMRYGMDKIKTFDYIVGIGGVEVSKEDYIKAFKDVREGLVDPGKTYFLRGGKYV